MANKVFSLVINRVFAQEPSYREFFKNVGGDDVTSPEFTAHAQRVLGGLDMVISLGDVPETAQAALTHLHHQHEARGIPYPAYSVSGIQTFTDQVYLLETWD